MGIHKNGRHHDGKIVYENHLLNHAFSFNALINVDVPFLCTSKSKNSWHFPYVTALWIISLRVRWKSDGFFTFLRIKIARPIVSGSALGLTPRPLAEAYCVARPMLNKSYHITLHPYVAIKYLLERKG